MSIDSVGVRIKALRKQKGYTLKILSDKAKISISFLSDIENGRSKPSLERLQDIAVALDTTTSYLMNESHVEHFFPGPGSTITKEVDSLTKRDKRDIAKDLEKMMAEIENEDSDTDSESGITFYGEPLDDLDKQLLKNALKHALENVKIKNKEKYTPKKYKKDK